jgi:aspartyl/asparaginyl beta-hydroxylase (cupin superfamily)
MDIGIPIRDLGEIDISPLKEAILAVDDDAWLQNSHRQTTYDVHDQTQSLVMLFIDTEQWPKLEVTKDTAWALLSKAATPIIDSILSQFYPPGGTIVRAMAAKLVSGGVIKPHFDKHPSFHAGHRIHIPITTNSRVRFMIDGRPYKFEVGKVYEINNQKQHSVMNKGADDRINFIFDYIPPGAIASLRTP